MKYLKSYKIFESLDNDLIEDIKDLLIDLEDEGYKIDIRTYSFSSVIYIMKIVPLHETDVDRNDEYIPNLFEYSDVEYYVNRLISFIKSEKPNMKFKVKQPRINEKVFTEINREIENNLRLVLTSYVRIEFYEK